MNFPPPSFMMKRRKKEREKEKKRKGKDLKTTVKAAYARGKQQGKQAKGVRAACLGLGIYLSIYLSACGLSSQDLRMKLPVSLKHAGALSQVLTQVVCAHGGGQSDWNHHHHYHNHNHHHNHSHLHDLCEFEVLAAAFPAEISSLADGRAPLSSLCAALSTAYLLLPPFKILCTETFQFDSLCGLEKWWHATMPQYGKNKNIDLNKKKLFYPFIYFKHVSSMRKMLHGVNTADFILFQSPHNTETIFFHFRLFFNMM